LAKIILFSKDGLLKKQFIEIDYNGSVMDYCIENYYKSDIPFIVYEGDRPSKDCDITFDVEKMKGNGTYTIIETPAEAMTIISVVLIVLSVATILLLPKPKLPSNINRRQESPNNALGNRSNEARPLQRIPDIKGKVKSIPDVIMPTYRTFLGGNVREHGYYSVGRGQITIEELSDGDSLIDLIPNASAGIYYPNTSPNSATPSPFATIGDYVAEDVVTPFRSNEVDGVVLLDTEPQGAKDVSTVTINVIFYPANAFPFITEDSFIIYSDYFADYPDQYYTGNTVILTGVTVLDTIGNAVDISGTYEILLSTGGLLDLRPPTIPFTVNPVYIASSMISGTVETQINQPYFQDYYMTSNIYDVAMINISAPNGLYKDTGAAALLPLTIEYLIEVDGIEKVAGLWVGDGTPTISTTASFTSRTKAPTGITVSIPLGSQKAFRLRCKRTTARFEASGISDQTKLTDLYGLQNVVAEDFGDITTIQTFTIANQSATSQKQRQLNCIATENVDLYLGGGVFAGSLTANVDADGNSSAVQSFIKDSLDPYIGNRDITDIAADDMLAMELDINAYFGNSIHSQFNFTFDSTDITYQEYSQTLFNAINCIAYRDGTTIKAIFERQQDTPAMLFTHRSKRPNSETYSRSFTRSIENDGVEFNWVNPDTNVTDTITLSVDGTGITYNPKTFNIAGIRNETQATVRANRELNKIKYKKLDCSVEVTAEGRFVRPNDRIDIVKGSRVLTQDGEVMDHTGLTLTLSSDVSFDNVADVYSITLKLSDGSTENIICTAGANSNQVILSYAPSETLRTGTDSRRTEFSFGNDARHESESWLIQEIDLADKWFVSLKGINYTNLYYYQDTNSLDAFSDGFSDGFS